jgi:hypothetical protein
MCVCVRMYTYARAGCLILCLQNMHIPCVCVCVRAYARTCLTIRLQDMHIMYMRVYARVPYVVLTEHAYFVRLWVCTCACLLFSAYT